MSKPNSVITPAVTPDAAKEVTYAQLHTPFFIPTIGNFKDKLNSTEPGSQIKMYLYPHSNLLTVIVKGVEAGIPLSNVQNLVFKK